MINKINILPSNIYNKISAGEVVENPASIVKELVENSIDAGATSVTIEIENAGLKKIKVSDNGCGISFSDLKNAFVPHATSKIASENDLESIATLGFRGEALASIASVSKVKLVSKPSAQEIGGMIEIEGGDVKTVQETGSPTGTYIIVSDLFYNTPARFKFLKKSSSEQSNVTDLVSRLILANYLISFKYIIDGKIYYQSTGKNLSDAVFTVYKKDALNNSIFYEYQFDDVRVYGYLGNFDYTKPNKTYQTLVVNSRYVQNATVSIAVSNAYEDKLMKRQFPFYILFIDFPYEKIDVNVHPRKTEIKFDDNKYVYRLISSFIDMAFGNHNSLNKIRSVDLLNKLPNIHNTEKNVYISEELLPNIPTFSQKQYMPKIDKVKEQVPITPTVITGSSIQGFYDVPFTTPIPENEIVFNEPPMQYYVSDDYKQTKILNLSIEYRLIGQLFDTYILVEYNDKLIIIDQHAAHERLLYDKLILDTNNKNLDIQDLLLPYTFSVNNIEYDFIITNIEAFNNLGFDIREFGNFTLKLSSVPAILSDMNISFFITTFLKDISGMKKFGMADVLKDKLASLACKAAIKAGMKLEDSEIKKLISAFNENSILLCPHGRPIIIELDKKSIEKWFKRIV